MKDQRHSSTFNRQDGVRSNYIPFIPSQLAGEYSKFYATLTPAQRAELGASESNPTGEIRPLHKSDEYQTSEPIRALLSHGDDSTLPRGGIFTDAILHQDCEPVEPSELNTKPQHLHLLVVHTILRRVLRIFECASEPSTRLHGDVVAIALGIPGFTVATVARTYGVTRQAVSKRLRRVIAHLGLPPTERMAMAGLDYTRHGKPPRKARGCLPAALSRPKAAQDTPCTSKKPHKPKAGPYGQSGSVVGRLPVKPVFRKNRAGKQG